MEMAGGHFFSKEFGADTGKIILNETTVKLLDFYHRWCVGICDRPGNGKFSCHPGQPAESWDVAQV